MKAQDGGRPLTLEEALRLSAQDPEYQRAKAEVDDERARRWEMLRNAQAPLVEALNGAGYPVSTVWELVESGRPYASAVPILLEHLQRPYPEPVRDKIARALAIQEASDGWPIIVHEFMAERADSGAKQGLASALAELVNEERLNEYLELVHDQQHGESRMILLLGLQRLSRRKHSRARAEYEALADDPVLGTEVRRVLSKRRG